MSQQPSVDWHVIEEFEGFSTTGYIPVDAKGNILGHSGVTIACGFDLGQYDEGDLNRMNFPQDLINKFRPYLGLQGQRAKESERLEISTSEAYEVNRLVHDGTLKLLVSAYDSDKGKQGAFAALPSAVQTVIASVAFQYGAGNPRGKYPRFWQKALDANVEAMVEELRNFGDAYRTRRVKESNHLVAYHNAIVRDHVNPAIKEQERLWKEAQQEFDTFAKQLIDKAPWVEVSRTNEGEKVVGNQIVTTYKITKKKDLSEVEPAIKAKKQELELRMDANFNCRIKGMSLDNSYAADLLKQASLERN